MSSCEVIDRGLFGGPMFLCQVSDAPDLEQLERRAAPGPGTFRDQVERYLSDCYAARAYLDRTHHPTENGALHPDLPPQRPARRAQNGLPRGEVGPVSWWEWLLWRYERRRDQRLCAYAGHDISDAPALCADGLYRWTCRRCPHRFRADLVVQVTDQGNDHSD